MYDMDLVKIEDITDAKRAIEEIGSDPQSIDIMAPKAVLKVIKLKNIVLQDAIIIKQDMLSIGGEVAVPKKSFDLKDDNADILIIGTLSQLNELVKKLSRHYSRIKKIADDLSDFLKGLK